MSDSVCECEEGAYVDGLSVTPSHGTVSAVSAEFTFPSSSESYVNFVISPPPRLDTYDMTAALVGIFTSLFVIAVSTSAPSTLSASIPEPIPPLLITIFTTSSSSRLTDIDASLAFSAADM